MAFSNTKNGLCGREVGKRTIVDDLKRLQVVVDQHSKAKEKLAIISFFLILNPKFVDGERLDFNDAAALIVGMSEQAKPHARSIIRWDCQIFCVRAGNGLPSGRP